MMNIMKIFSTDIKGRRADERGAAAVIIAGFIGLLVPPLLALVFDVGVLRVANKDMQAVADVVSLDLARRIDGRSKEDLKVPLDNALAQSVARNKDSQVGSNLRVTYELGILTAGGTFSTTAAGSPNAVRVTATTAITPIFRSKTDVSRTAIASSESNSCILIGTNVVGFNGSGSPLLRPILNGLLGVNTGITAVGYEGLANVNVSLGELASELGVGQSSLLNTDITFAQLLDATIDILDERGAVNAQQVAVLQLIRASGSATLATALSVGDILGIETGNAAVAGASLDVLSLIYGGLTVISPNGSIAVPALDVGPLRARLVIGEPAQMGCIGEPAKTAAASVMLGARLPLAVGILGLLDVNVQIEVKLAEATASVTSSGCHTNPGPGSTTGAILSQDVAQVIPNISVDALLRLIAVDVNAEPSSANPLPPTFTIPNGPYNERGLTAPQSMGNGDLSLSPLTGADVDVVLLGSSLLRPLLGDVVSGILNLLNPIISLVNEAVVHTIGPMLGVTLNGLDVYGVEKPVCHQSSLRG